MQPEFNLNAQYDRFISQLRDEVKYLYWLYNFFFLVESGLVAAVITGKIRWHFITLACVIGFLLSFYWFWIILKQKLWRDEWLIKIHSIEKEIGCPNEFRMWPTDKSSFTDGKNGLWKALFILPAGFAIWWFLLLACW